MTVGVRVVVTVGVGVKLAGGGVREAVTDGVTVGAGVAERDGVRVGVTVGVAVADGVGVMVMLRVTDGVGNGEGAGPAPASPKLTIALTIG